MKKWEQVEALDLFSKPDFAKAGAMYVFETEYYGRLMPLAALVSLFHDSLSEDMTQAARQALSLSYMNFLLLPSVSADGPVNAE